MSVHADLEPLLARLRLGHPAVFSAREAAAPDVVACLARQLPVRSVGDLVLAADSAEDVASSMESIREPTVITRMAALTDPRFCVNVVDLLRILARRTLIVAEWPGDISHGRLRYSTPGRFDYIDEAAHDFVILHPRPTTFPDEIPFTFENG